MATVKLIAANWKMNGRVGAAKTLVAALKKGLAGHKGAAVLLCPPSPLLSQVAEQIKGSVMELGAQDCSQRNDGAYTGDVSAPMLRDIGCSTVILGHSERRAYHREDDSLIACKMRAAHRAGLKVILCVGEKDAGLDSAQREAIIKIQLSNGLAASANATNTVIAYEPVWAIGSGLVPTAEQIIAVHAYIATCLPPSMKGARVLYGGSVNAKNAASILKLSGVDGALVGGASLKADDFLTIIAVA